MGAFAEGSKGQSFQEAEGLAVAWEIQKVHDIVVQQHQLKHPAAFQGRWETAGWSLVEEVEWADAEGVGSLEGKMVDEDAGAVGHAVGPRKSP